MKKKLREAGFWLLLLILVAGVLIQLLVLHRMLSASSGLASSERTAYQRDKNASLIRPSRILVTESPELGAAELKVDTSGYQVIWKYAETVLEKRIGDAPQACERTELQADGAYIVCQYEYGLEPQALKEYFDWDQAEQRIQEIRIQPEGGDEGKDRICFINWDEGLFYYQDAESSENDTFYETTGKLDYTQISGAVHFPGLLKESVYVSGATEPEYHYPVMLNSAFMQADGTFDEVEAKEYLDHFFTHPDVAKELEDAHGLWYSDEKCSLEFTPAGMLTYRATPQPKELTQLSLHEAYQEACGFLEQDMAKDTTRYWEYHLASYEVTEQGYRFCWDYDLEGHLLELQGSEHPIQIEIEGSIVRSYQRLVLDREVNTSVMKKPSVTYLQAADRFYETYGDREIYEMRLCYVYEDGKPVLNWKICGRGAEILFLNAEEVYV